MEERNLRKVMIGTVTSNKMDKTVVVSVETSTGTLKIIRIGNNSDHYLREKKILSYNYIDKRIITK